MSILTVADLRSVTWRRLHAYATERLERHQRALAQIGLPAADTEALRGRIAELNQMLSLADQASDSSNETRTDDVPISIEGLAP